MDGERHLVGDREEGVAEQLGLDRVDGRSHLPSLICPAGLAAISSRYEGRPHSDQGEGIYSPYIDSTFNPMHSANFAADTGREWSVERQTDKVKSGISRRTIEFSDECRLT